MSYIQKIINEKRVKDLNEYIKVRYGEPEWRFEIFQIGSEKNELNLSIADGEQSLAWFLLKDYDCFMPADVDTSYMDIDKVDAKKLRKIYLSFMMKTYPDYEENLIKKFNDEMEEIKSI